MWEPQRGSYIVKIQLQKGPKQQKVYRSVCNGSRSAFNLSKDLSDKTFINVFIRNTMNIQTGHFRKQNMGVLEERKFYNVLQMQMFCLPAFTHRPPTHSILRNGVRQPNELTTGL